MSTFFNDNIFKELERTVTTSSSREFSIYVQKFMDKNSEILNHNIPSKRLFFYPKDMEYPFECFGISIEMIEKTVDQVKRSKECFGVINQVNFPFNFLMLNLIRYYELKNNKDGLHIALMYITLYQYSTLHYKYYKKFLPNEDCMQYTYNRISDKYYFRKYQTVFKALFATTINNHESMKKLLHSKNDMDLLKYLLSLRNRLNNQMKSFTNEYQTDFREKNYLKLQADSRDEENYYETTNLSGDIVGIVNKSFTKFNTSKIDPKILRTACGIAKAEVSVMRTALENIKDNEMESIRMLILSMIQLYIYNSNNSINEVGSQKFFTYMLSAYSKSNSKNDISLSIKSNLDKFLNQYCNRYSNTEREATKINYRKALYIYFILLINNSKNN